jgi:hypothetical protein
MIYLDVTASYAPMPDAAASCGWLRGDTGFGDFRHFPIVLGQATPPSKPAEYSFDDPSAWDHDETSRPGHRTKDDQRQAEQEAILRLGRSGEPVPGQSKGMTVEVADLPAASVEFRSVRRFLRVRFRQIGAGANQRWWILPHWLFLIPKH